MTTMREVYGEGNERRNIPAWARDPINIGMAAVAAATLVGIAAFSSCESTNDNATCRPDKTYTVTESGETLEHITEEITPPDQKAHAASYSEYMQQANPRFPMFEPLPIGADILTIKCDFLTTNTNN
jgi:hypothetical protein